LVIICSSSVHALLIIPHSATLLGGFGFELDLHIIGTVTDLDSYDVNAVFRSLGKIRMVLADAAMYFELPQGWSHPLYYLFNDSNAL